MKIQTMLKRFNKKFGFTKDNMTLDTLKFRLELQTEEHDELYQAVQDKNAEEVVDALVDSAWIAIGTLDMLGVNVEEAFAEVGRANLSKRRGTKKGREQSDGFDVIKPLGWVGPDHSENHGVLDDLFS